MIIFYIYIYISTGIDLILTHMGSISKRAHHLWVQNPYLLPFQALRLTLPPLSAGTGRDGPPPSPDSPTLGPFSPLCCCGAAVWRLPGRAHPTRTTAEYKLWEIIFCSSLEKYLGLRQCSIAHGFEIRIEGRTHTHTCAHTHRIKGRGDVMSTPSRGQPRIVVIWM